MPLRFRRSIKLLPGFRLNFGKRGVSTSIGVRGAHVTFGKTGTRTTVGLPGSGLSYAHLDKPHSVRAPRVPSADDAPESGRRSFNARLWLLWILLTIVAATAVLVYATLP